MFSHQNLSNIKRNVTSKKGHKKTIESFWTETNDTHTRSKLHILTNHIIHWACV